MGKAARIEEIHLLTVEEFLATPQSEFGPAWRYELVDGVPVAQAGPSREHAQILNNLSGIISARLWGSATCEPLTGAPAIPRGKGRRNARIPDATIECGAGADKTVIMFEVVSPADDVGTTLREQRRKDLKDVPGAALIIEIRQDAPAVHVHRRVGDLWAYDDIVGIGETLRIEAIPLEIALSDIYHRLFELPVEKAGPEQE